MKIYIAIISLLIGSLLTSLSFGNNLSDTEQTPKYNVEVILVFNSVDAGKAIEIQKDILKKYGDAYKVSINLSKGQDTNHLTITDDNTITLVPN